MASEALGSLSAEVREKLEALLEVAEEPKQGRSYLVRNEANLVLRAENLGPLHWWDFEGIETSRAVKVGDFYLKTAKLPRRCVRRLQNEPFTGVFEDTVKSHLANIVRKVHRDRAEEEAPEVLVRALARCLGVVEGLLAIHERQFLTERTTRLFNLYNMALRDVDSVERDGDLECATYVWAPFLGELAASSKGLEEYEMPAISRKVKEIVKGARIAELEKELAAVTEKLASLTAGERAAAAAGAE